MSLQIAEIELRLSPGGIVPIQQADPVVAEHDLTGMEIAVEQGARRGFTASEILLHAGTGREEAMDELRRKRGGVDPGAGGFQDLNLLARAVLLESDPIGSVSEPMHRGERAPCAPQARLHVLLLEGTTERLCQRGPLELADHEEAQPRRVPKRLRRHHVRRSLCVEVAEPSPNALPFRPAILLHEPEDLTWLFLGASAQHAVTQGAAPLGAFLDDLGRQNLGQAPSRTGACLAQQGARALRIEEPRQALRPGLGAGSGAFPRARRHAGSGAGSDHCVR